MPDAKGTITMHPQSPIPWWDTISPTIQAELALPAIGSLALPAVDVVVIGAGVAGLSAAVAARQAGASVLVLEADSFIGRGATGRNAGILSAGINMHLSDVDPRGPEAAFWPETTRVLLSLVEEASQAGSLLSASLTGSLSLAETKHAARALELEASARSAAGLRAALWSPSQVAEHTRGRLNAQSVINALWLPDEGCLNPLTLLAHLARQARASGVQLAGQACVDAFSASENHASASWRLALANGMRIDACGLILAVGPTAQPNARIYALAFAVDLPDDFPLFWDASPYTYADYRPGDGRLGVSGGRYGKAGVTRSDAKYHQRLAEGARHWLPELQDRQPTYTWAVDLAVSADMVPIIRPISDTLPGWAIEGLGALGVLPGIVLGGRAGEYIAAQIR
jgi:glycine/D-amino acid oxidase-like deaminating enzyme